MEKVYIAEVDRFGSTLTAVGHTEEEAVNAICKAYIKQYIHINGCDPREDERPYDDATYYDNMYEDIIVKEIAYGEVEWW